MRSWRRFEDCSVADLKRALGRAGKPERVPREVRDAIERLDEAVGEDAARGVSFRLGRAGDVLVDVRGVPFASARAALVALSKAF